jgi:hypothetical protein
MPPRGLKPDKLSGFSGQKVAKGRPSVNSLSLFVLLLRPSRKAGHQIGAQPRRYSNSCDDGLGRQA